MAKTLMAPATVGRVVAFCVCLMLCATSEAADRSPAVIELTSPSGDEAWAADSYHYITWTTRQSDAAQALRIEYTIDGGDSWVEVGAPPADGKLLWRVPNHPSTQCRVRISDRRSGASAESRSDFSIVPSQEVSGYEWVNATSEAAFAPRDGAGALVWKGRMWLLGGWHPGDKVHFPRITNNEVWSSEDGAGWKLVKPNTFVDQSFDSAGDWQGRHTGGYVVYRDKMWLVGGDANLGHYQFDVWNSADGRTWTCVNKGRPVPWGPRALHYTLAFKDKIWVLGGQTMPAFAAAEEIFYRDIWNTTDGVNWEKVSPQEPYPSARGMIGGGVVFQDRMWVLGGGTYDTPQTPARKFFNDVWSSADGVNWKRHVESAPWRPRQYHSVAVFDGRMWVLGGWNQGDRSDVWYSADGVNWYQLRSTPWARRHAASVFVHDNALWIAAGSCMQPDVWKLERQAPSGSPTEGKMVPVAAEKLVSVALRMAGFGDRTAYIYDEKNPDTSPYPLDLFDGRAVSVVLYAETFGVNFYGPQGENTYAQLRIDAAGDIHFDRWVDGGAGLQITIDKESSPPTITVRRNDK